MINRPCPSVCYLHVLTKAKGKGTWALPEILPRLWTTIWQRGTVWKTPSQQTLRKYQPCASTRELLNNTKNVSIKTTLSITTLAQYFYPATLEEHPMNNMQWKSCNGKKMHQLLYFGLGGKMISKGIFLNNIGNLYKL